MLEILTYLVGGVITLTVILLTILIFQIYNEDHPLNQERNNSNNDPNASTSS